MRITQTGVSRPTLGNRLQVLRNGCLLLVFLFSMGCLRSLHPLFTQSESIMDPDLVGTWVSEDQTLVIEPGDSTSYRVIIFGKKDSPAKFKSRLGQIGRYRFLDLYPDGQSLMNNSVYKLHELPAHTFLKLELNKKTLYLSMLSAAWFDKLPEKDQARITHERVSGYEEFSNYALLTGRPNELKELVSNYAENTVAFPKPTKFIKR